jgi:formate dehydrogenase major subunit
MTNHWNDLANSDCILIMGSNAAENHPISFKWVTKAIERGATLISVDPRFTRTSSKAHIYAALRSGTDIAFLGGMIKFILDNELYHKEYMVEYTNAAHLINEKFDFQDGLYSGYDPKGRKYDKSTWSYQNDEKGIPKRDKTLQDPNCVFQLLKKHYSRYNVDIVSQITGTSVEKLFEVYKAYAATGKTGKAGTIMYAMGWTQHTVGTQNIRTMAIIQLLLGNIGICGGGVNALRGESNVQGSTDHCLLFHILPGYLKTSNASQTTLEDYNKKSTSTTNDPNSANWWGNYAKYSVSFLKSMYGNNATKENEFGYAMLPKLDDGNNYSWITLFQEMYKGNIKGFFAWGMNPASSGPNSDMTSEALGKLDWMVNVNLWETETGAFWKRPGVDPRKIKTEVFLLPCAASVEKEGSITNSSRWMQWRYKAVDPPGEALPDAEIIHQIHTRVKELYEKKSGAYADPILKLKWDYATNGHVDIHRIAKEINGYDLETGRLLPSFAKLKDDGMTSSGNWLYCGSYTESGNMAARRDNKDASGVGLYSNWSWCWPVNRRILYNRASVDLNGQPFDKEHPVIRWDASANEGKGTWVGDVPDGGWVPMSDAQKTKFPFIMKPEGFARIFGMDLADGPLPEHYEPLESPLEKNLLSKVLLNPTAKAWHEEGGPMNQSAKACDPRYPFVATTYRVAEHWQTGAMTRQQPWLVELQPEMFVEMSQELGNKLGISNGDNVIVESARGKVRAKAIVTARFKPFRIGNTIIHEVGMPWCFGFMGLATGDSANKLTPNIGDANTMIPESKAFLVNVRKEV